MRGWDKDIKTPGFDINAKTRGSVCVDYASIASTGQTAAQAPQSMQASASILYCVSPAEIADTGHSLSQVPQLMHESVMVCAMKISSFIALEFLKMFYTLSFYTTIF